MSTHTTPDVSQHRGDGAPPEDFTTDRRKKQSEPIPGEPAFPGRHCNCGPRRDPLTEGERPRPVTVATARRCKLWEDGTLILKDSCGSHELGAIDENLIATSQPSDPTLEGCKLNLLPEWTLTFIPS